MLGIWLRNNRADLLCQKPMNALLKWHNFDIELLPHHRYYPKVTLQRLFAVHGPQDNEYIHKIP